MIADKHKLFFSFSFRCRAAQATQPRIPGSRTAACKTTYSWACLWTQRCMTQSCELVRCCLIWTCCLLETRPKLVSRVTPSYPSVELYNTLIASDVESVIRASSSCIGTNAEEVA